jgi:Tol biopolymer transport system component
LVCESTFFSSAAQRGKEGWRHQLVNGGSPLRRKDAQAAGKPAWSPDGSRLAFIRRDGAIYVMPALGGVPQRISAAS